MGELPFSEAEEWMTGVQVCVGGSLEGEKGEKTGYKINQSVKKKHLFYELGDAVCLLNVYNFNPLLMGWPFNDFDAIFSMSSR